MAFQGRSSRGLWDLLTISKLQARHKLSETGETESTENNVVAGTFAESMALKALFGASVFSGLLTGFGV
jgi:hypothetical protein